MNDELETWDITTIGDKYKHTITGGIYNPVYGYPWSASLVPPPSNDCTPAWENHSVTTNLKDSGRKFKIQNVMDSPYRTDKYGHAVYALCITDVDDLSSEWVLKAVSAMKARLMLKTHDVILDHFECKMTPEVRKSIVNAWRKIEMYGKQPPFVPRFDEYLNELPEKFNVEGGIIVKMVDPEEYGLMYFELDAIQIPPQTIASTKVTVPDDFNLPF